MPDLHLPAPVRAALGSDLNAVRHAVAKVGGTPFRHRDNVTLLYAGIADGVEVRHWLDIFPDTPPFQPLRRDDLWATTFRLEPDARIEYKLAVRRHGRQRLRNDGLNPIQASNPLGSNSVLRGAEYSPPEWAMPQDGVRRGLVTRREMESKAFGDERAVHIYQPAFGDPEMLLVVHDGSDYLDYANLGRVLDNLIAAESIPPLAAVMVDPRNRMDEYRASPRHASFVAEEVVPFALAETGATQPVAMGASLGGVASLHAAWLHPGVFSGLILQAGSFVTSLGPFGRGHVFTPVVKFMEKYSSSPGRPPERVHVSCGRYDGLIGEARVLAEQLRSLGVDVGYADNGAGHDWHGWRDLLRDALIHVSDMEGGAS